MASQADSQKPLDASEEAFRISLRANFYEEATFLIADTEQGLLELGDVNERPAILAKIFRAMHSIKGSGAAVGYTSLSSFAHLLEDCLSILRVYPKLAEAEAVSTLLEGMDHVKKLLEHAASNSTSQIEATEITAKLNQLCEVLRNEVKIAESQPSLAHVRPAGDEARPKAESEGTENRSKVASLVKIDAERIDSVLDLVGELVVIKSQLLHSSCIQSGLDAESMSIISLMERTIRALYDKSLAMRMTSLKSLFLKVQRTIRDLSERLNKPIILTISGENTELDRALIEQLGDPLIHLCRNAIDHGIEAAAQRKKNGKQEVGQLRLAAYRQGAQVIIEVSDDGNGINTESVIKKARSQGILPEGGPELPDSEIFKILFHPGFSTAAKVTEVSGRGVGLDVVKSNVDAMKGQVEIISKPHEGTTFRLSLPLTTAITDGMVIDCQGERYILPIESIKEFVTPAETPVIDLENGQQVVEVRKTFMPLVHLNAIRPLTSERTGVFVVIESGNTHFALLVDAVLGQSQVVLKSLQATVGARRGIAGAAILGDGKVALVLDVSSLAPTENRTNSPEGLAA